ncbi:MAG: hypothetical protein ABIS51_14775 [Sphingomonas sp.]
MHGEDYLRSGDPYTTTIRNVCEACNNTWMSRLQDEAKPAIYALATGELLTLNDHEKFILARWSAMVTINFECHARMLRTKQLQRTMLMNGKMPPGWRASIARMIDTDCAGRSFHRALATPVGIGTGGDHVEIGSTYYVIERAAFHTLNSLGDGTLSLGLLVIGRPEAEIPMTTIWPSHAALPSRTSPDLTCLDLDDIERLFGDDR